MSIETLIASALSQVIHLSHHYDAASRAVYFLLFTIRGTRIGGFKWAVGGGELKARFIIESMRSQICDFFDSSRQNTITLVQTKTHEVYRPQEHANTKQTSFFSVFQPCATIYVTECTVYADKSFAAQACIHMKHV